jgi:multidrug efflux pump subunit AcrB
MSLNNYPIPALSLRWLYVDFNNYFASVEQQLRPAGFPDPTFFTATAMIGMIALAGIVVRNSIILIDFIHHGLARGLSLENAIIEAGTIRLRPIAFTAAAAMLGSAVITLDPIFSGLAWAFIFGIFASTAFTLIVVPLIYYLVYRNPSTAD